MHTLMAWDIATDEVLLDALLARGVNLGRAELLVLYREEPSYAAKITEILS